jgi:hypothetical protein
MVHRVAQTKSSSAIAQDLTKNNCFRSVVARLDRAIQ